MPHQYSQTWRDFNPTEFVLANFSHAQDKSKKEIGFKRVLIQVLITILLFSLFTYTLKLIDNKYSQPVQEAQVIESYEPSKVYNTREIYEQFQKGYIGQGLIEVEEYVEVDDGLAAAN